MIMSRNAIHELAIAFILMMSLEVRLPKLGMLDAAAEAEAEADATASGSLVSSEPKRESLPCVGKDPIAVAVALAADDRAVDVLLMAPWNQGQRCAPCELICSSVSSSMMYSGWSALCLRKNCKVTQRSAGRLRVLDSKGLRQIGSW